MTNQLFPKVKKNLKFLIKIQYDDEENAIINQIAPILNQLSMDETNHIDDFLYTFFTEHYQEGFEKEIFTSTVNYMIRKKFVLFHQIKIKPFIFYEFCYKYHEELMSNFRFFEFYNFYENPKDWQNRIFATSFFFFYLLEGTSWNPDFGFSFSYAKFFNAFYSFLGIEKSYSKRQEMLGRKINFRRKLQKKKFEDY